MSRGSVYVAAKYEDHVRVREVQNTLRLCGWDITYDWTTNEQVSPEQAQNDFDGVRNADAFVLIAERDLPYCGALVELGIALALEIPVHIIGHALDDDRC